MEEEEQRRRWERQRARELRRSPWWQAKLRLGLCYYCGEKVPPQGATMDHVVPLSQGGRSQKGNLVLSCKACNVKKKSFTAVEWLLGEGSRED